MSWQPTVVVDPTAVLIAELRDRLPLLEGRVFGEILPGSEAAEMPRTGALVRHMGGPGAPAHLPLVAVRVDVHAYGPTPYAAMQVHWSVFGALRDVNRLTRGGTLIHSVTPESGPFAQTDPDTEWPEVVSSWLVLAAERVPVDT